MMIDIQRLARSLPLDQYGKGEAKTFQNLLDEIKNGEAKIAWLDDRPIRLLRIIFLKVKYQDKILMEDRQEFPDGRVRHRGTEGIAEKLYPQEVPDQAVKRALREELGFRLDDIDTLSIPFLGQELSKKESPSFPGLESHYELYRYETCLPDNLYQPEYMETGRDGKKTYFLWK